MAKLTDTVLFPAAGGHLIGPGYRNKSKKKMAGLVSGFSVRYKIKITIAANVRKINILLKSGSCRKTQNYLLPPLLVK